MKETVLFRSPKGEVSNVQLVEKLKKLGASECDILYIHTDMTFGLPSKDIKRSDLLGLLAEALLQLNVETLIFPTFTFNFCNDEVYDVQNSRTFMGALNEYVRKNITGRRSLDPILSVYLVGTDRNLVDELSRYSIGVGSNYDRLHNCGKEVKFLFFGADMRLCFTYTHYIEAVMGVPYRYNRPFVGEIVDNGTHLSNECYYLYSTYSNVRLNPLPVVFDELVQRKLINQDLAGAGSLCCLRERDAFETISELIWRNPLCLTDGTFKLEEIKRDYSNDERIVSVK